MENEIVSETGILDEVDIEEYGKRGEEPPHARRYRFRLDDHHYVTEKPKLTGREILEFASKTPETYHLRQRTRGGQVRSVNADDIVNLREPGVERFTTIPKENTDGGSDVR